MVPGRGLNTRLHAHSHLFLCIAGGSPLPLTGGRRGRPLPLAGAPGGGMARLVRKLPLGSSTT
jgi:hypothetical protein